MKNELYLSLLRQEMPRSTNSSNNSNIMQTENPTHIPRDPPIAEMKVVTVYLAVSVMVLTLSDMKYTSSLR